MENSISLVIHSIIIYPCELKHRPLKSLLGKQLSGQSVLYATSEPEVSAQNSRNLTPALGRLREIGVVSLVLLAS